MRKLRHGHESAQGTEFRNPNDVTVNSVFDVVCEQQMSLSTILDLVFSFGMAFSNDTAVSETVDQSQSYQS